MLQVNLEEAKDLLFELINAVLKGETVLISKDLQEAVQLVLVASVARRQFGSAKGLIVMADNFDTPLPDFNTYMICHETAPRYAHFLVVYRWR
jgi:antitoxin (DNA-binding transcriptional repressor) of toxin-antitoxin stability system